jgi:hypothetical protein
MPGEAIEKLMAQESESESESESAACKAQVLRARYQIAHERAGLLAIRLTLEG